MATNRRDSNELHGTVSVAASNRGFQDAPLHVRLEYATFADARATIVCETTLRVSHRTGEPTKACFRLPLPPTLPKGRLLLRAHVDVDADGQISQGDLVTQIAYSVRPTDVDIEHDLVVEAVH